MSESLVLVTEKRESRGTRQAGKLRKQGKVPGVVYGHKEETVSVSLPHDIMLATIKRGMRVVDIDVGGKVEKAQIVEVQWDYLGKDVLHVDFKRVSADERIEVELRIEIKGIAPGVAAGGVLDQPLHTVRVECPALAVPDSIKVLIGELQIGQAIHVKDLKLPEGVTVLEDPDAIVIHVTEQEAEPEPGAVPAGQAEPEVITRKKPEEGEEE